MQALEPHLSPLLIRTAVEAALAEDLGRAGDVTTNATIPATAQASCVLGSREDGVLAGIEVARTAFVTSDEKVLFETTKADGETVSQSDVLATIKGNARGILASERVALNFLMRMSGIATYTSKFARAIEHTDARICCTRKTVPGLRAFDKYAVRCGGGSNHRFGLDDAILIKDNHIAVAGSVGLAIERAKAFAGHLMSIEVEVDTLEQFEEALNAAPDAVLLDNMTPDQLSQAVAINRKAGSSRVKLEASGNVSLDTVVAIAETGVDFISTSKITMAAPTLDVGLDIKID